MMHLTRNAGFLFLLFCTLILTPHNTYGQASNSRQIQLPQELEHLTWSPDGTKLALATGISGCDPEQPNDHALLIMSVTTGQIINRFLGHSCRLIDVAWSPDGSKIASSGFSQSETYIWDAKKGKVVAEGDFQSEVGVSVAWSPDSTKIVSTVSGGQYAFVWDAKTGERLFKLPEHNDFTTSAAWSPDGNSIVTTSLDRTAKIWDVTTQQEILTLKHPSQVYWAAWSPDGSKIATASSDHNVYVWDRITGQLLTTLEGHTDEVEMVDWSADGLRLASGCLDGSIRIWDVTTGQTIQTIEGNLGPIMDVKWSPVENKLAYIGQYSGSQTGLPEIIEPQEILSLMLTPTSTP